MVTLTPIMSTETNSDDMAGQSCSGNCCCRTQQEPSSRNPAVPPNCCSVQWTQLTCAAKRQSYSPEETTDDMLSSWDRQDDRLHPDLSLGLPTVKLAERLERVMDHQEVRQKLPNRTKTIQYLPRITTTMWFILLAVIETYSSSMPSAMAYSSSSTSSSLSSSSKASWRTSPDIPSPVIVWHEDGSVDESSSLHWEPVHDLKDFSFAVEAGGNHNSWQYVCRARHDGEWVPGRGTSSRICHVPWKGREFTHTSFQVLVSPELSANTRWVSFKKKLRTPNGALVSAGFNIIRQGDPESELGVSIGRYNYTKGAEIVLRTPRHNGYSSLNQTPSEFGEDETSEVLVELEPVKYQLTNLAFQTPLHPSGFAPASEESVLLAHDVLENPTDQSLSLSVEIPYKYTESMRIVDVVGAKVGIPTVFDIRSPLQLNGGIRVYLRDYGFYGKGWGETVTKGYSNVASAFVEDVLPQTSISVSVLGRLGLFDLKFTGSLRATYEDGSTITRFVSGVLKLKKYLDVGVAYGLATSIESAREDQRRDHFTSSMRLSDEEISRLAGFAELEAKKAKKKLFEKDSSSDDDSTPTNWLPSHTTEETLPTWKVRWREKTSSFIPSSSSASIPPSMPSEITLTEKTPLLHDQPLNSRRSSVENPLFASSSIPAADNYFTHLEASKQLQEIQEQQRRQLKLNRSKASTVPTWEDVTSAAAPYAHLCWWTVIFFCLVAFFARKAVR